MKSTSAHPLTVWTARLCARLLAAAWLLHCAVAHAAPVVSPHLKLTVPAGAGLVDLTTPAFDLPADCAPSPCTDQRVMVAKFVVDAVGDVAFELRATDIVRYPVTPFTTAAGGAAVSITDNEHPELAAASIQARFLADSAKAGWRILVIRLRFDNAAAFPAGEKWKIQVQQAAAARHFSGFRVDGAVDLAATPAIEGEELVTKPQLIRFVTDAQLTNWAAYVDLPEPLALDFGQVHISLPSTYVPDQTFELRNVGTAPLHFTSSEPATFPGGGPFAFENYPTAGVSVLPMDPLNKRITFQPTVAGAAASNVTFTTNAGVKHVNISGRGITLRSAILLDLSGSMERDENGVFGSPPDQQKLAAARLAALQLAELYRNILPQARLGLYSYPDRAGTCPNAAGVGGSQELVSLSIIDTNIQGYRNRLNANLGHPDFIGNATGETPMAAGIGRVWSVLVPKPADTLAAVFQIGDGQHSYDYCDSPAPHQTPEAWYNDPAFAAAKVPFFTIPYGAFWEGSPTTAQFQQIASRSRTEAGQPGTMFPADLTDETALQTQFTKALGTALELETLKDPKASIAAGASATHSVCVTESSQQVVFSVHWALKNASAVEVKLETPDHTLLTPASPGANPGHLSYSAGDTFADYVVRGKYLSGNAGSGVWKIHVKGNQATSYVYQVLAQDRIKTQPPKFNWGVVGQKANFELAYPGDPSPIVAASIHARYEAPSASFNNYLATTPITPELLARVPEEQGRDMTLAEKKHYALVHFAQKPFTGERVTTELQLGDEALPLPTEPAGARPSRRANTPEPETLMARSMAASATTAGPKSYLQELPVTKYAGLHTALVTVIGATAIGECFQREYSVSQWADIALTPGLIQRAVRLEEAVLKPFFSEELVKRLQTPQKDGFVRKSVTLTPVDEQGNYFGMGRGAEISISASAAQPLAALVDNLDGSYTQVLEYARKDKPTIVVGVGDVASTPIPLEASAPDEPGTTGTTALPSWKLIALCVLFALVLVFWLLRKRGSTL